MRLVNLMLDREWTPPLPIYVWVVEHPEGAIVIDTGETAKAMQPGYFPSWQIYFRTIREAVTPEQEIGPQLRAIGLDPTDVRWVIMTHLHTDHAGGLGHLPKSEILVMRSAYETAKGFGGQVRGFLPQHWPQWFKPKLLDLEDKPFGSFPMSFALTHAGDVTIVPTFGHTPAHVSVILQDAAMTYFFAGDASYTQQLMLDQHVDGVAPNENAAKQTLGRVRGFVQATPTVYLPTHDPESANRLLTKSVVQI